MRLEDELKIATKAQIKQARELQTQGRKIEELRSKLESSKTYKAHLENKLSIRRQEVESLKENNREKKSEISQLKNEVQTN